LTNTDDNYPGTPQHQTLLRAIVSHYQNDPRILAVVVFGSLSRGTSDQYSDIDLDVVIADGVRLNAVEELERLCGALASIGENSALIVPDGDDAGDVVFESLMQLSARYHPLSATHPNIVDSLRVLMGRIDHAAIAAAGSANRRPKGQALKQLLDRCVRYAVVADVAVQRHDLWAAVEMLHRLRGLLMELYARARGGQRPAQVFQADADPQLQARLGRTLPQYDLASLKDSLGHCIEILEHDLGHLTKGQVQLTDVHRKVLGRVRARQEHLGDGG
jgi:predicted nucleotidyltransferase